MKLITAKKGDPYEAVEMDIRALLNGKAGNRLLDSNNAFKKDTDICFNQKRDDKK